MVERCWERRSIGKEIFAIAIRFTINPTWPGLQLNLILCRARPATSRLSHGTILWRLYTGYRLEQLSYASCITCNVPDTSTHTLHCTLAAVLLKYRFEWTILNIILPVKRFKLSLQPYEDSANLLRFALVQPAWECSRKCRAQNHLRRYWLFLTSHAKCLFKIVSSK